MKATYHLAKRFLERVLGKKDASKKEIYEILIYLQNILSKLDVKGVRGYVAMPGFSNYVLAYNEGIATTILKKKWVKYELLYRSGKISKREFSKIKALKEFS